MNQLKIPLWIQIIECLDRPKFMSQIARELNTSYCHVRKIVVLLKDRGIVKTYKRGMYHMVERLFPINKSCLNYIKNIK